jgi:hypothetical protein
LSFRKVFTRAATSRKRGIWFPVLETSRRLKLLPLEEVSEGIRDRKQMKELQSPLCKRDFCRMDDGRRRRKSDFKNNDRKETILINL